jgi:uncharacterized protein
MPGKDGMRIVVDTNIWISFLIGKRLSRLRPLLASRNVTLVISDQIIEEITRTARLPKICKYFAENEVKELVTLLRKVGHVQQITSDITLCRDPKDDFLLSLAQDSHATYLVTGDLDLLALGSMGSTKIVSVKQFEKILEIQ